jgi:hypothetical protein
VRRRRREIRAQRRRSRRRWIAIGAAVVVTAVGVGVGAAAVSRGGDEPGSERQTAAPPTLATTTTTVVVPTAPLTGLPDPTKQTQQRAALSVKIENTPDSRPQSGLDVADVVYEEIVEGGITRFWAVFHTTAPANVGPIRSVRYMDPNIVSPIGGLVAFSGGTPDNVALMRRTPTTNIDENNAGNAFFREASRYAPHNLYGVSARLWERGGEPIPPRPLFKYLDKGEVPAGEAIDQFRVGFQTGYDPTYTFDDATRTWKRSYGSVPFMDVSGKQIAPANVIVQFVDYPRGAEGQLVGQGEAWVFTGDRLVRGRWSKADANSPTVFVDAAQVEIELVPGRTWVELLNIGAPVDLVAAPPPPPTTMPPATTTTAAKKANGKNKQG